MFYLKKSIPIVASKMLATCRTTRHIGSNIARTSRTFCTPVSTNTGTQDSASMTEDASSKISGFAKAFEKQSQISEVKDIEQNYTFASLLRNSKLMDVSYLEKVYN